MGTVKFRLNANNLVEGFGLSNEDYDKVYRAVIEANERFDRIIEAVQFLYNKLENDAQRLLAVYLLGYSVGYSVAQDELRKVVEALKNIDCGA